MGDDMNPTDEKFGTKGNRRGFLKSLGTTWLTLLGADALAGSWPGQKAEASPGSDPALMSPNEDLMQEHALLNRVLLVYEEAIRRLEAGKNLDPDLLKSSAQIIQHFVEQYHEKLEEDYVFPRFEKAGKLLDLVRVLREQHKAGRLLTQGIISTATLSVFKNPQERKKLAGNLTSFIRMYRPHETREGSVLFPAFRDLIPAQEFQTLGDLFEKKEHELLGAEGFEGQVQVVAGIERQLGIFDLSQYTPG
jgi:hemerythrin-like domain-containing protein